MPPPSRGQLLWPLLGYLDDLFVPMAKSCHVEVRFWPATSRRPLHNTQGGAATRARAWDFDQAIWMTESTAGPILSTASESELGNEVWTVNTMLPALVTV